MSGLRFQKAILRDRLEREKYGKSVDEIDRDIRMILVSEEYPSIATKNEISRLEELRSKISSDEDIRRASIIRRKR